MQVGSTRKVQKNWQLKGLVLAVSLACSSLNSFAQEQKKLQAAPVKEAVTMQKVEIAARLEDDVNTAKTSAGLRDLPMSISIVPADVLQDQAALLLDSAIKNVSGLTQSSTNNYGYFNNFLARGLQVNFLRDGLPDGPAVNGYARTLSDVQQIEVLKGPGSALFGSGTPGGFVNLVSKAPDPHSSRELDLSLGSFHARQLKLDLTGPVGDEDNQSAQYRFITSYLNKDGYRGFGNKTIELLPSFRFKLDKDHSSLLSFRHYDSTILNDSVGMIFRNHQIINMPQETRFYTPFTESTSRIDALSFKHEMQVRPDYLVRADFSYGKRDLDFRRNVPNWRLSESATATRMVNRNWRDQEDRLTDSLAQVEAVWKGVAAGLKHEVVMGVGWNQTSGSAMRKQALLAPVANVFAPVFPEKSNAALDAVLMWDRQVSSAQAGVYLQDQLVVSKEWKVRAGLRFDRYTIADRGQYNSWFDAGGAFTSTLAANQQSFVVKPAALKYETASVRSYQWNPSLGAVYQPSETTSYYVGASGGSFSNFTTEMGRTAFAPETSRQIELGNKSVFLKGALSSNIALYDTERKDYFQTATGLSGSLGSVHTRGLDAEITARPLRGWQMRLAYAYQDAKYTRYINVVDGTDDAKVVGNRVAGSSRNQVSIWSTYDFQKAALKGFGVGGGVSYRDAFYVDVFNDNLAPAKPVIDLLAYYRTAAFDIQLNIGNAANVRWYKHGAGENSAIPGDTRSLQLSARFKF